MKTILIKNGILYDGTGRKGYKGDLLVLDGMIGRIGEITHSADKVIDATGMAVTPGFVDIHRHCDIKPLLGRAFGDVELAQGITTVVVGNCGISITPGPAENADEMYRYMEPVLGRPYQGDLHSYGAYLKKLEQIPLPLNFCTMIGTGSVNITVKGFENRPFTQEELSKARGLVEEAMQQGAAGVSIGIMYVPECYSNVEEYARILEPVGRYGGVVTAHIRGEGDSLVESVEEVVAIGRQVGCAIHISHFKSCGINNWRRKIHQAVQVIESARARGQDVTCDFYPYEGGSTTLTTMIPPALVDGDMGLALKRLGTEQGVEAFRTACEKTYPEWDNYAISLGWERILISGVGKERNRKFIGKSVEEAAKAFGFADGAACAAYLLHDEEGKVAIINMSMCQEDIETVAKLPYSMVISDSIYGDTDTPHPRLYGAFPKIIREYVGEKRIYTMEEAVHRMSGKPARRMGLAKRGVLMPGCWADINVFDPCKFRDNATFAEPAQLATGLEYCLVNGEIAVERDVRTGGRHGVNIRIKH